MGSWSNLCRCCLSPNSEVSFLNNEDNVKEKFLEVTNIQVKEDDGLPQKLCLECFSIMTSAYHFRTKCMKMDKELKVQLDAKIKQTKHIISPQFSEIEAQVKSNADMTVEDIAKESMKQLECIIKSEPNDDDDYHYNLVTDNPTDKEDKDDDLKKEISENIQEPELLKSIKQEVDTSIYESSHTKALPEVSQFENCLDSLLVSNPPISIKAGTATILENKEQVIESQYKMNIDATQEAEEQELSFVQDEGIIEKPSVTVVEDTQEQSMHDYSIALTEKDVENSKNIIKILSPLGSEQVIFLKNDDSIKSLTDAQLSKSDNTNMLQEHQVIFCEGEDSSQFQILNCDGSELVIEYTDESQITTVLQQEDGTFLCDSREQFDDLSQSEEHQWKHNSAGDLLCNLCGKGFETPEILADHMALHNVNDESVKCLFCSQLVKRNNLTQHIKYAHNNEPKCIVCLKTFASQNSLKRHMMIHKDIREFECDICHKRFVQKINMRTHRLTHINPYVCNKCGSLFENQESLVAHTNNEQCYKSKAQKVNRIKKGLMKTVKQQVTTNLGKLLGYACSLCKKMFALESELEEHIESTHIKTFDGQSLNKKAANIFSCSICGKGFAGPAKLIMHERVHTNERPFSCQLCSSRFKTKTHLKTHQMTHTKEKKFGCSVCMKFFTQKGNLVAHLRTHTGERPYVCHLCNEAFIGSKYLKRHKLKKHGIDKLPWNQYST